MKDMINTGVQLLGAAQQLGVVSGDPLAAINTFATTCNEIASIAKIVAVEKTKRTEIIANRDVRIETIRAQRDAFMEYLNKTFDERSDNFEKIFDVIDNALENDNIEQLALGLDSLNKLAAESPFKVLADINALGKALDQKTEFEF